MSKTIMENPLNVDVIIEQILIDRRYCAHDEEEADEIIKKASEQGYKFYKKNYEDYNEGLGENYETTVVYAHYDDLSPERTDCNDAQNCDYCGKEISLMEYYHLGGCCGKCAFE